MDQYALGFCFSEDGEWVALIKKAKPDWQAGRLNGIGGKLEEEESFTDAIKREFFEETGVELSVPWLPYAHLVSEEDNWEVRVFTTISNEIFQCESRTDEEVVVFSRAEIISADRSMTISNVPALVSIAYSVMFSDSGPAEVIFHY